MPSRPRRLLRGQGHGEGDPHPGANEQEPDDRGAGQVGDADLSGDILNSQRQVQDQCQYEGREILS